MVDFLPDFFFKKLAVVGTSQGVMVQQVFILLLFTPEVADIMEIYYRAKDLPLVVDGWRNAPRDMKFRAVAADQDFF